jgi:hypothetical protein
MVAQTSIFGGIPIFNSLKSSSFFLRDARNIEGRNRPRSSFLYLYEDSISQAYEWALEAMKYMSRVKPEDVKHPGQSIKQLRQYLMTHRPPSAEHFTEMIQLAQKLNNEKLLDQCKVREDPLFSTFVSTRLGY